MCRIKSGLIFKNKIVVAPAYNDSHSSLLESMGIEDNYLNAEKMFVRVELSPSDGDLTRDVNTWKYKVDQDITPEWYEENKERYETEFRDAVEKWMKEKTVNMFGKNWSTLKRDDHTYFILNGTIGNNSFGEDNNYNASELRDKIISSDLHNRVVAEFGDRLVPITSSLMSLDGLKEYGNIKGDLMAALDFDTYRNNREDIINIGTWFWLANPYSTPSGYGSSRALCVCSDGYVGCNGCRCDDGVRPFFILKSII